MNARSTPPAHRTRTDSRQHGKRIPTATRPPSKRKHDRTRQSPRNRRRIVNAERNGPTRPITPAESALAESRPNATPANSTKPAPAPLGHRGGHPAQKALDPPCRPSSNGQRHAPRIRTNSRPASNSTDVNAPAQPSESNSPGRVRPCPQRTAAGLRTRSPLSPSERRATSNRASMPCPLAAGHPCHGPSMALRPRPPQFCRELVLRSVPLCGRLPWPRGLPGSIPAPPLPPVAGPLPRGLSGPRCAGPAQNGQNPAEEYGTGVSSNTSEIGCAAIHEPPGVPGTHRLAHSCPGTPPGPRVMGR